MLIPYEIRLGLAPRFGFGLAIGRDLNFRRLDDAPQKRERALQTYQFHRLKPESACEPGARVR